MHHNWLIWQVLDSAFPTGGFAHSAGLEASHQHGEISSTSDLIAFLCASIDQAAAGALPFALAVRQEPLRFEELDALHDSMLSNHVANRASRAQGKALIATTARVFQLKPLVDLHARTRTNVVIGHAAPVWGAVASAVAIDPIDLSQMFLFMHLRSLVTAAVRLGIVGPMQAQAIQQELSTYGSGRAQRALEAAPGEAGRGDAEPGGAAQTAPLLDLLQSTHDRLYSKLFIS